MDLLGKVLAVVVVATLCTILVACAVAVVEAVV
jgi:hypothetical protein